MANTMSNNALSLTRMLLTERPLLMRLVQRIVGSASAAEDVTQSMWLRIQRIDDHPPIENKRAYLYRLARNLAIDHAHADRRRAAIHAEAADLLSQPVEGSAGERPHLARDQLQRIAAVIATLPVRTQEVFILSRLEGLSYRDIAARLGISRPTVEKHLRLGFDAVMPLCEDTE